MSVTNLLHPETLTVEELSSALQKRGVLMDDPSCGGDKYRLVELFYAYLLPLPQRKYRPNRRGKALTKSQIKLRKQSGSHHVSFNSSTQTRIISQPAKRKSHDDASGASQKKHGLVNDPKLCSAADQPSETDAKSAINFEHKVIKLGGGESNQRKLTKPSDTKLPEQSEVKPVNTSMSTSQHTTSVKMDISSQTTSSLKMDISSNSQYSADGAEYQPVSKKRNTITWP